MIDIKSIWDNQKPEGNVIVKTKIDEISHLNCFLATNHITGQHLYIFSVDQNIEIPELKSYRFKGVEIFSVETESALELNIYLIDNELKNIFTLFVQNILEEILDCVTESEALNKTLNIISRWKKLFDKITFTGLTIQSQKGLIGELLFFNHLLDNNYNVSTILNAWTGPENEDKDYLFGSNGIEIKLTESKYPKIKITNEGQLDTQNLSLLYLVLYTVQDVKDKGFTLNSLIENTREKIKSNIDNLKFFNERLQLIGYYEDDKEFYTKMYSIKQIFHYRVTHDFPKIVKSQLPIGLFNTSYSIELSAVEQFLVDKDVILKNI